MSTARPPAVAPLIAGQKLSQADFHERYEATPPGFRAELIGGIVVMPSPVGNRHGIISAGALFWLGYYRSRTRGVEVSDNATAILDDLGEVQPDALLRIKPENRGQTRKHGKYIGGAPELVVEVADSSKATDLGAKLADYERAGTREYVVLAIEPDEVHWHELRDGRLVRVAPDPDGLYRSRVFPGLWLDPNALLNDDGSALVAVLERGLATEEHAAFVADLAARPERR
ncbi:Uma2 family endonuclease [Tundrisphaera lichenicola]|uniref:Uma2 family endonuclease n=1 Tax=Tundrisphaera lichenicola TaxID=2029860 RepID=UPI003EBB188B